MTYIQYLICQRKWCSWWNHVIGRYITNSDYMSKPSDYFYWELDPWHSYKYWTNLPFLKNVPVKVISNLMYKAEEFVRLS